MCGRFTNRLTWREIVALYRLTVPANPERNLPARYNICPTTTIDAVVEREGKRELVSMRWGLVPSWWKKTAKETPSTFNARAETVAEKPMFRSAFKRNRCLIPASGYYEWQNTPTGKQPYYYKARDGSPLTIAGLWDEWKDIETHEPLKSCTMIITNAKNLASKIHDRMPVLLQPKDFDRAGRRARAWYWPHVRARGECQVVLRTHQAAGECGAGGGMKSPQIMRKLSERITLAVVHYFQKYPRPPDPHAHQTPKSKTRTIKITMTV
jgi:putative SOS response-associated peptidase YedK